MNQVEVLGAVEVHLGYSRQQNLAVAEVTVRALRDQKLHELTFKAFGSFAEDCKKLERGAPCLIRGEFRENHRKDLYLGLMEIYEMPPSHKENVVFSSQGLALNEGWQNVNLLGRVNKVGEGEVALTVSSAGGRLQVPIKLADLLVEQDGRGDRARTPVARGEGLRVWGQFKEGYVHPLAVLPLGYKR